jgi:hypothetical protein
MFAPSSPCGECIGCNHIEYGNYTYDGPYLLTNHADLEEVARVRELVHPEKALGNGVR